MKKKLLFIALCVTIISVFFVGCSINKNTLNNKLKTLMTIGGTIKVPLEDSFLLANEIAADYNKVYGDLNKNLDKNIGNHTKLKEKLQEDILTQLKEQKLLNIYFRDYYSLSNSNVESIKELVDDKIAGKNATKLMNSGISKDTMVNFYIEEYIEALTKANIKDNVIKNLTDADYKIGYFDCVHFDNKTDATDFYNEVKNGANFKKTAKEMVKDFSESSLLNKMIKGTLNESLEKVVYNLKQDEIPPIIESSIGGYYVIKCTKPYAITTDKAEKKEMYDSLVKFKTSEKITYILNRLEEENTVDINYDLLNKIKYIY